MIEQFPVGKAITLDGTTDSLFNQQNIDRTASIFKDLWSTALDQIKGLKASLTSRLIPLNKVFPRIPTRKQMRPILVCSPIQRLLEARFLPKLTAYLRDKLDRSQVGFVPGQGTQVNILRALCVTKIALEEKKKKAKYGLFIDFANAYNTVPHTLLFQKLRDKKCLDDDEIDFLEALYSRYRIKIGKKVIRYNRGVAQGSILSPALFNIFIEDLAKELADVIGISFEEILFYADDILVLCQTEGQIKQCIKIIEEWSKQNGMELNKKKSGILPFGPRRAKEVALLRLDKTFNPQTKKTENKWIPTTKEISGIPVVTTYKYLGTHLDPKLTIKHQLNNIERKANFLYVKLYPYLTNATADGRRDMWKTMVAPQFDPALMLSEFETSKTEIEAMNNLILGTFKKFLMIPITTNSPLVWEMIGEDWNALTARMKHNAGEKWFARRENREPELIKKQKLPNYLRGIPNAWCDILKQQCRLCSVCKKEETRPRSICHMRDVHQVDIEVSHLTIWEDIKKHHDEEVKKHEKKKTIMKLKRGVFLDFWKPLLEQFRDETDRKLQKYYSKINEKKEIEQNKKKESKRDQ